MSRGYLLMLIITRVPKVLIWLETYTPDFPQESYTHPGLLFDKIWTGLKSYTEHPTTECLDSEPWIKI